MWSLMTAIAEPSSSSKGSWEIALLLLSSLQVDAILSREPGTDALSYARGTFVMVAIPSGSVCCCWHGHLGSSPKPPSLIFQQQFCKFLHNSAFYKKSLLLQSNIHIWANIKILPPSQQHGQLLLTLWCYSGSTVRKQGSHKKSQFFLF